MLKRKYWKSSSSTRYIFHISVAMLLLFTINNSFARGQKTDYLFEENSGSGNFKIADPYFQVIYNENGINHMNVNLVDLILSGLKIGDEIGVFDGIYCVGAAVIEESDVLINNFSILASANDTLETNPNGFIRGHAITLKMYRDGIVYDLMFDLINNSKALFEPRGSMFALVNSLNSTSSIILGNYIDIKVYPNPFSETLNIELDSKNSKAVYCEVFDSCGRLVKTLINGTLNTERIIVWDGKNENNVKLLPGNYYLRVNDRVRKIILIN